MRSRLAIPMGSLRALSLLLSLCTVNACQTNDDLLKRAFSQPGRAVLVVTMDVDRSAGLYGPSSVIGGLGVGVLGSIGLVASIIFIPLIPFALYLTTRQGATTGRMVDAVPDWRIQVETWMAERQLEESFRSDLQSRFELDGHVHPTAFSSRASLQAYFDRQESTNLTVVAVYKVKVVLDHTWPPSLFDKTPDVPDPVGPEFSILIRVLLFDAEADEVLGKDSFFERQDADGRCLSDYLADDCAELDVLMTNAVRQAADNAAGRFEWYMRPLPPSRIGGPPNDVSTVPR